MRRTCMFLILASSVATPAMAETVEVGVDGMVCAFCVAAIEEGFKKEPAVKTVDIDLDAKRVTITSVSTVSDEDIREAIDYAGYTVRSITRVPDEK